MNSENRQTLYAIRPHGSKARAHTSYLVFKNAEARRDWVDKLNNDLDNWRMYVGVIGVVENLYPGDKQFWARPIRKDGKGLKAHEIGANDSRQIGHRFRTIDEAASALRRYIDERDGGSQRRENPCPHCEGVVPNRCAYCEGTGVDQ